MFSRPWSLVDAIIDSNKELLSKNCTHCTCSSTSHFYSIFSHIVVVSNSLLQYIMTFIILFLAFFVWLRLFSLSWPLTNHSFGSYVTKSMILVSFFAVFCPLAYIKVISTLNFCLLYGKQHQDKSGYVMLASPENDA